jgi:rhamnose transport system permease protein
VTTNNSTNTNTHTPLPEGERRGEGVIAPTQQVQYAHPAALPSPPLSTQHSALSTFLTTFPYWHELTLLLLLILLFIFAHSVDPPFLNRATQLDLSTHIWELALLALPMTLIIITAGIDLSIGATMALSAVILGLAHEHHAPIYAACGLALGTATAAGALNAFFISKIKVHPLIVTLATLSAYRGIAEGISQARPISGFPESFAFLGQGAIAGFPFPAFLFVALAILTTIILAKTPFGRSLYAIGFNPTASRFSGIPVARIKFLLYTLSGTTAGLAAILFVSRRNTAKADIGLGLELDVITAVVLGGTSIFGGKGKIPSTLLGILLIHETREFVSWHYQYDELIPLVIGTLLIFSVLLNSLLTPRSR